MFRQFFLYLSQAGWARRMATQWGLTRRMGLRFVAGESLAEAIAVAQQLNAQGLGVTLDYLGESVHSEAETVQVVQTYQALAEQIAAHGLHASISLKPTHLGLDISEDLCLRNLRSILASANAHHIPVTIDMESTHHTEATLRLYRTLRDEYDFPKVGTVIQAYLYRSEADMQALAGEGAHIRLCKGAYLEGPEVAFPQKSAVDANYIALMRAYLAAPAPAYLCIATHDDQMIAAGEKHIKALGLPAERYEFQMLYGVRSGRQLELVRAGHPMRVYVPFGAAWYPYFMRRLAERPANVWFFLKNFFKS
jgi:proline dehydrogenase